MYINKSDVEDREMVIGITFIFDNAFLKNCGKMIMFQQLCIGSDFKRLLPMLFLETP